MAQRLRDALWKLNQRLHSRQRLEQARRRYADRDAKENSRTALPDGERISWPCMWMCEVFAPSHAKAMVRGIEGMEEANPEAFLRSNDLGAWLEKARSTGGGYLSVGSFSTRSRFPSSRPIDLPDGFASVHVDLHQLAPGITLLIFRFDLDDKNVECLTRVLRQSFGTSVSPSRVAQAPIRSGLPRRRRRKQFALNGKPFAIRRQAGSPLGLLASSRPRRS